MNNTAATKWIRAGLVALPVCALLTVWTTIGAQPDAAIDPDGWARFVSSTSYLAGHAIGSFVVFVLLGAALGMATTGASLSTQPIAARLMAISGGWIAWAAMRRPAVVVEPQFSPV